MNLRKPAILGLILCGGSLAGAKEIKLRANDAIQHGHSLEFQAKGERIRISIEEKPLDGAKAPLPLGEWGYDPRPDGEGGNGNKVLVNLLISIDGKPLVIPGTHLAGLFNPSLETVSLTRDSARQTLEVTLFGGSTPYGYDVTFSFKDGIYLKREIGYVKYEAGGPKDARVQQPFVP